MNEVTVSVYRMNPHEDRLIFGDELEDDMWVLREDLNARTPHDGDEDSQIRRQRFRRVTRLRRRTVPGLPPQVIFIGEWVDGYQETWSGAEENAWIVKKDPAGQAEEAAR